MRRAALAVLAATAAFACLPVAMAKPAASFDKVALVKIDLVAKSVTTIVVEKDGKVTLDRNPDAPGPVTDAATSKELKDVAKAYSAVPWSDVPADIPPPKMLAGGLHIQIAATEGTKDRQVEALLGFYGKHQKELAALVKALEAVETRVAKAHPIAPTHGLAGAIPH